MPERWQRELRRLREVSATPGLWQRVSEGPSGREEEAALPRRRQRVVAGVVAFVVFIAAGAFAWNVLSPTRPGVVGNGDGSTTAPGPGDLVVTLRAPAEPSTATELHPPTAVFRLGEQATEIPAQGMTGWPDIPGGGGNDPLYSFGFGVPAGTRLVIQGDATSASASIRNGIPIDSPTRELDLSGGSAILPSDPGLNVIELTGVWDEGTATFTALFKVVPIEEAAVLTFDEQDPEAPQLSFTVGGTTFPAILGTHSWTFDNGSGFADAATPTFTDADMVQVASGTRLLLQDAPPTVSIMANDGFVMNFGPKTDLSAPGATFDLPPGRYLVVVDAMWGDAQAQFWLAIEIVDRPDVSVSSDSLVPSGGTYSLSDFEIEMETPSGTGEVGPLAIARFAFSWIGDSFPGKAQCTMSLMGEGGEIVGLHSFGFMALERSGRSETGGIRLQDGTSISAEARCGPGMLFGGAGQYVFSNLHVEPGRVVGDISWSEGTPVGEAACAARITSPEGDRSIQTFTLAAGPVGDGTVVLLSANFPDAGTAEVRCEPYRVPEQLDETHWLPWIEG